MSSFSIISNAIDRATDPNLLFENWEYIMDVCDKVNENPVDGPKEAVELVQIYLEGNVTNRQIYSLVLIDALAQNCGSAVHSEIASRSFTTNLLEIVSEPNINPTVKTKAMEVMETLSREFRGDPTLRHMEEAYNLVKQQNPAYAPPEVPQKHQLSANDRQKEEDDLKLALELSLQDPQPFQPSSSGFSHSYQQNLNQDQFFQQSQQNLNQSSQHFQNLDQGQSFQYSQDSNGGQSSQNTQHQNLNQSSQFSQNLDQGQPFQYSQNSNGGQSSQNTQQNLNQSSQLSQNLDQGQSFQYSQNSNGGQSSQNTQQNLNQSSQLSQNLDQDESSQNRQEKLKTETVNGRTAATVSRVRALYDLSSQDPTELTFKKGDIIMVIESVYRDWWRGSLRGKVGIFPLNYVTPISEPSFQQLELEVREETNIYSEAKNVEKLLVLLKSNENNGASSAVDEEELEKLYHSIQAVRPKLLKLIEKYSQKKDDLIDLDKRFVSARKNYDQRIDSSLAHMSLNPSGGEPPIGASSTSTGHNSFSQNQQTYNSNTNNYQGQSSQQFQQPMTTGKSTQGNNNWEQQQQPQSPLINQQTGGWDQVPNQFNGQSTSPGLMQSLQPEPVHHSQQHTPSGNQPNSTYQQTHQTGSQSNLNYQQSQHAGSQFNVSYQQPQSTGSQSSVNHQQPQPTGSQSNVNYQQPQPTGSQSNVNYQQPQPTGSQANINYEQPQSTGSQSNINYQQPQPTGSQSNVNYQQPQPTGSHGNINYQQPQPTGSQAKFNYQQPQPTGSQSKVNYQQHRPAGSQSGVSYQQPQPTGSQANINYQQPQPTGSQAKFNYQQPQPTGSQSKANYQQPNPTGPKRQSISLQQELHIPPAGTYSDPQPKKQQRPANNPKANANPLVLPAGSDLAS